MVNHAGEEEGAENAQEELEDAVNFTADKHVKHFQEMFLYYDLQISEWVVCQTADNCLVNKKIALNLSIPHVGCKSHILNLEVNEMVKNNEELIATLQSVQTTMLYFKQRLKNAAILRNIVILKPVLHIKTRWSSKSSLLERFVRLRDEFVEVSRSKESDVEINRTPFFKNKCI